MRELEWKNFDGEYVSFEFYHENRNIYIHTHTHTYIHEIMSFCICDAVWGIQRVGKRRICCAFVCVYVRAAVML